MTIIGFMAGFAFGYSIADLVINIYETITKNETDV